MSSTDSIAQDRASKRAFGLRANSLAAMVMLLLEFGLGIWVNLYGHLPASDQGKSAFTAFAHAVADGPVGLSLHALLGTLLVVTAAGAVVRTMLIGNRPMIAVAGVALLAILAAWSSGAKFVGNMSNGPSLTMALATAVALLCYAVILFVPVDVLSRHRVKGEVL
ncbi:MAG TPA: hypothetical protein VHT49_15255 [Acidimicrobiales bacterium]|jgi:hypothetical protein|nr:hypothetical protein [Acidimicrobiales bacterium]